MSVSRHVMSCRVMSCYIIILETSADIFQITLSAIRFNLVQFWPTYDKLRLHTCYIFYVFFGLRLVLSV